MENNIYSLWISGELSNVNLLTIRSCKNMGYNLIIYSFQDGITNECEVRDAREILPESEIFYYKNMMGGNPNFKFGGIAEKLKAHMLYKLGGTHIDLDVTLLKRIDYEQEFVFRPHPQGIVCNFVKAPQHSDFARFYVEWTNRINSNNTDWELSFKGLKTYIDNNPSLKEFIRPMSELGSDLPQYWWDFMKTNRIPDENLRIIHWCNALRESYTDNSFYAKLLKQYSL